MRRRRALDSKQAQSLNRPRRSPQSQVLGREPSQAQQQNQRDDPLRNDAIEAPHLQNEVFDRGQPESKIESDERGQKQKQPLPRQCQRSESDVARNAERSHRHTINHRKRAVIHHAAIPPLINRAGLGCRGVVNLQSQRGNHNAGHCQNCYRISHLSLMLQPSCSYCIRNLCSFTGFPLRKGRLRERRKWQHQLRSRSKELP